MMVAELDLEIQILFLLHGHALPVQQIAPPAQLHLLLKSVHWVQMVTMLTDLTLLQNALIMLPNVYGTQQL